MPRRRGSRKIALDVLYEQEINKGELEPILNRHASEPAFEHAEKLVLGVAKHKADLDRLIESHSIGWALDRMPSLDLSLLRLGAYEILHEEDVPAAVTINELVDLAKRFSTQDSSRFVNGILARLGDEVASP